ncbi:MAG: ABC transporter permease [Chloroflexi bacterium]|nr:ABC transporter permease [Chloroflexota bacterium]
MHNFALLLKKELWENWANGKIVIVFALFTLLSILAPHMSYENNIGNNFGNFFVYMNGERLLIDFYQYLEMILVIFIPFIIMGAVASEIKNNTAASLLVKPIGRAGYILSKFIVYFLIFGVAATVAILFSTIYAHLLVPEPIAFSKVCLLSCLILVFIAFAVALLLFLSTIIRNHLVAGAIGLCILLVLLSVTSQTSPIFELFPGELFAWINEILSIDSYYVEQGLLNYQHSPAWPAFFVSIISSVIFVIASIFIIKRKEL